MLFDEVDTIFGPKAGADEALRGFLNAGYRRIGGALRCVGDGSNQNAQVFNSYCASPWPDSARSRHGPDSLGHRPHAQARPE